MTKRLLILLFLFQFISAAQSANCLPDWKYTRSITVSNTNTPAYTNQPVKVILNTQALIAAGKMNANGDDLRFTDASCNVLHYWIDSNLNTTTTVIWVKVPAIPSSGSTTIQLYYGNYCAAAYQNGDSTFMFFDDFIGGSLNTGKWTSYRTAPGSSSVTVTGGRISLNTTAAGDNIIRTNTAFPSIVRMESKVSLNTGDGPSIALLNSATFNGVSVFTNTGSGNNFNTNQVAASGSSYTGANNSSGVARANGYWSLYWNATNSATGVFPNGSQQSIVSTPAIGGTQHLALGVMNSGIGAMNVEWTRARLYVPNEFSSTVNAETSQGVHMSFTPKAICPGGNMSFSFSKNGVYFNTGNSFKIELSDSNGLFGSPLTLATINDTVLNSQILEIPKSTLPGTRYRIRLTSTNPSFSCYAADSALTVYPKPNVSYTVPNDSQCYKYNKYNFNVTSSISSGTINSYVWAWDDFTMNDTLTNPNTTHSFYPFYVYYYPRLTAISNLGCRDSFSRQVNILETPNIRTVFNDTIQCLVGNFFEIKSETVAQTGSITFKSIEIGDGSPVLTNVDSFTHSFTSDGIYQVTQINWHSNGCKDTNYLGCLVNEHPVADIVTNDTDQCLVGNDFIFEANSSINNGLPLLNYWDLTGGNTRDQQDSAHASYSTASNRTIRLVTISDDGVDGCTDTAYQDILVNPMPKAIVTNVKDEQCFNYNKFTFIGKSTIAYGTMSHDWDFGDLSTSTDKDTAEHSYGTDGSFNIKVIVTSDKGCVDSTTTSVVVRPSPIPIFNIPNKTQCFKYHALKAYSSSVISSGVFSKLWNFSDGTNYTDVDSVNHQFMNYGDYALDLILTSDYNCKDTISDSLHILPMPSSGIAVDNADQCFEGNTFNFTDNSLFSNGSLTGNKWLFGDGNVDFNKNAVNHVYAAEGPYVPGLIVYGDNGCFDTSFLNVKVYPHPGSDFIINDTGQCVNDNNFYFANNTFISEGAFTNRWYYGDGSPYQDILNGSKVYKKDSTYIVKVISYSDKGCTDTATKTVTVFPKANTNFTINNNQQCVLGNSFDFVSTTAIKYGAFTTNWQFGDGTILNNSSSATHSYINVQQYNVRLLSLSNEGCRDTMTKQVRTLPMPVADFNFNYNKSCLDGNDFQFNSTTVVSNGTPMNHNWYFGDGDSAINTGFASNTYANAGQYIVTLISSTNIGACKDTMTKTVDVYPMPVASFNIDDNRQCFQGNVFNITNTSNVATGTIDKNDWTFGDGGTSALPNPSKSYIKVDSFWIDLVVTTNNGCTNSTRQMVWVDPMPVSKFTVGPLTSRCLKNNFFKLTNKATIGNGGVITEYVYYYDYANYPNTDSANVADPANYTYAANGQYSILQKVTTNRGCWDTTYASALVNPNPNLAFTVDSVCLKDSSRFINLSSIDPVNGDTIEYWKWIFGDGRVSTKMSPAYKYRNVGIYDVKLIAGTNRGCVDTLQILGAAKVNPNPKAGFYYVKERSWENEVDIQYYDTSTGASKWYWNFAQMGNSTEQNPKLYYIDTLTQVTSLVAENNYGCRDTTTKVLFIAPDVIYYMASAFTPNDDNINETFKPIGLAYAVDYKFIVFNRWGDILFSTDNPQLGWDGKYMGELVQQDLYFYRLEFVGADELRHEEKGSIMILR